MLGISYALCQHRACAWASCTAGLLRADPNDGRGPELVLCRAWTLRGHSARRSGVGATAAAQQAPQPCTFDRLVTLRFPGPGHARSVSSGSDAGSNGGDSGRASSQSRGHSGRGAAALGGARTGRTLFRARRVEDIQAEADRGRASPRSRSPRRRSLDHVMLSARGSPKTSPSSPQATRHRSRRHSLVLSIIGARRPRASSGAGRGGPLARLAGAGLDPTHSPGGVDWNAPSPRPPSPTFLALADAAFEMGVVARVALMLKRAVRTFKMRQPSRFRHHHRVCVRRPQLPEPCSSPDSDECVAPQRCVCFTAL